MVIFDRLEISGNGSYMYIDVHVNRASFFENIFLESITIMTADQVSETAPGTPTSNYIYHSEFASNTKSASLALSYTDFARSWETDASAIPFKKASMQNTLFFVYIKCTEGALVGCPPCTLDELTTVGVTFDVNVLYQKVMNYTRELANDCIVPYGFTDFILLWNAFKAAIETEHYVPAIKFYNMLFGTDGNGNAYGPYGTAVGRTKINGCGCHG